MQLKKKVKLHVHDFPLIPFVDFQHPFLEYPPKGSIELERQLLAEWRMGATKSSSLLEVAAGEVEEVGLVLLVEVVEGVQEVVVPKNVRVVGAAVAEGEGEVPTMVEEGHETEEPSEEVHEKVESLGEEVVVGVEPLKVAEEHATEEALVEF